MCCIWMSYKIKISYVHVPLSLNDWRQLKTMIFHMFDFVQTHWPLLLYSYKICGVHSTYENHIFGSLTAVGSWIFVIKCEQLTHPASVTVQPHDRLLIICQASYSVSDYYTAWTRKARWVSLETRFHLEYIKL